LTDLVEIFAKEADCVLLCADVHHSATARFVAETLKAISPQTEIFAFGRATTFVPQYFARPPFSALHESGDREAAITDYLQYLDGKLAQPAGVRLVDSGQLTPYL
jgi:hypothetical protein